MQIKFFKPVLLIKSLAVAGLLSLVVLGGCSGTGTLSVNDDRAAAGTGAGAGTSSAGTGNGSTVGGDVLAPAQTSNLTSLAKVAENTGNSGSSLGGIVESVGRQVIATLPDAGMQLNTTVGGVIVNTGEAVDALGIGVATGLGQLGTVNDPLNTTLQGLGPAVYNLGEAISAAGNPALMGQPLSLLRPVTTPVLSLVNQVGVGVSMLGTEIGGQVRSDGVRQVTGAASETIVPLAEAVMSTTQAVGNATGLGAPVNNLLVQIGGAVYKLGEGIGGGTGTPVAPVGQIVSYTGSTVAAMGGAVEFKSGDRFGAGVLAPVTALIGGLSGGDPAGALGSTLGGTSGLGGGSVGASSVLAPVTSALGSPGGAGGGLGGIGGGTAGGLGGATGILAPVSGIVTGVTGSLTGGTGNANNLLAPVTGVLGGLGGVGKK